MYVLRVLIHNKLSANPVFLEVEIDSGLFKAIRQIKGFETRVDFMTFERSGNIIFGANGAPIRDISKPNSNLITGVEL